jgi:hypothetical protein
MGSHRLLTQGTRNFLALCIAAERRRWSPAKSPDFVINRTECDNWFQYAPANKGGAGPETIGVCARIHGQRSRFLPIPRNTIGKTGKGCLR